MLTASFNPANRRQFFTTEMAATLGVAGATWLQLCWHLGGPRRSARAIVARDEHRIHFRLANPPKANRDKYADELLDAYLFIEDAVRYTPSMSRAESSSREPFGDTGWHSREFVVKDCDGRLLAFGAGQD